MARRRRYELTSPELTRYRSSLKPNRCTVCGKEIETPRGEPMPCGSPDCQRRAEARHRREEKARGGRR